MYKRWTDKTFNTKNVISFHPKSIFDDLELVLKIPQALKPHIEKIQIAIKKDDESKQRFGLYPNNMIKSPTREPFLIVRLPIL
jgi:hypothetical protein